MIDLGEDGASEIVDVPETDAPQRRTRERVRKPVAAVLSEVASATAVEPGAEEPAAAPEAAAPEEPAPEAPQPEPAEAATAETGSAGAPVPEDVGDSDDTGSEEPVEEGPKRRGWWSRALSGS